MTPSPVGAPARRSAAVANALTSAGDLLSFARKGARFWSGSGGEIVLQLPGVDAGAQRRIEKRLNFWRTVCGCQAGGALLLAALAWRGLAGSWGGDWTPWRIASEAALLLLIAVAAKALTIVAARLLLLLEILHLWRRVRGRAPEASAR